MENILTIIIPTFNMEKYLRHCLDSLIVPGMEKLEVLVINDGSKDSSSVIAHEYQEKYPQTFRVIDKENGNYGSCVNRGLKEATGKYVKILDADDSFNKDAIPAFIDFIEHNDADMVLSNADVVDEDDKVTKKFNIGKMDRGKIVSFETFASLNIMPQMHCIAYKRSVFDNLDYQQSEGISYTDQEWASIPCLAVKTVVFIDLSLYRYLAGRSGQTMDAAVMNRRFNDLQTVALKIMRADKKYLGDISHLQFIHNKSVSSGCLIYSYHIKDKVFTDEQLRCFDKTIEQEYPEVWSGIIGDYTYGKAIAEWRKTGKIKTPILARLEGRHPYIARLYYWLVFVPIFEVRTKILKR